MHDQRLIQRLSVYWNSLKEDAVIPLWQKFNPASFDDIWQQCCKWRVESGDGSTTTYTYEYVGASVKEAVGSDMTGKMFTSQFRGFPGARVVQKIDEVVKTREIIVDEGQFVNEQSKVVKYRSCLLPFGNQDGVVTHIVLGLSWRAY